MPVEVFQNRGATVDVILYHDTTGAPLSGIVAANITLYFRKAGGAATAKTIDVTNFREVDAVNMPGLYEIDLTESELDTAGSFVLVVQANGGVNLAQATENLTVLPDSISEDDRTREIAVSADKVAQVYFQLYEKGVPCAPRNTDTLTEAVPYYNVLEGDLTIPSQSTLKPRGIFGNIANNAISFGSGITKWDPVEIDGAGGFEDNPDNSFAGYYRYRFEPRRQDIGDRVVTLRPNGTPLWAEYPVPGADGSIADVWFHTDGLTGWACGLYLDVFGAQGRIWSTTDGGQTWATVLSDSPNNRPLYGIHGYYDGADFHILAVGEDGVIWYFDEGVGSWTEETNNDAESADTTLQGVYVLSDTEAWIVGEWVSGNTGYVVLEWNGTSASEIASSVATDGTGLYDVHMISSTDIWVCGGNGRLFHSTDGATLTVDETIATTAYFYNLWFEDANNGWVVGGDNGASGVIYYTSDGGATAFTALDTFLSAEVVRDIQMTSTTTGYATLVNSSVGVTDSSTSVLYTTDNWTTHEEWLTGGRGSELYVVPAVEGSPAFPEDNVWVQGSRNGGAIFRREPPFLFDRKTLQVTVNEDVVTELGGSSYQRTTQSLQTISDRLDSYANVDVSDGIIVDVGSTPTTVVKFANGQTGALLDEVSEGGFSAYIIKDGVLQSANLNAWTELAFPPGWYSFTLPSSVTTTEGEVVVTFDTGFKYEPEFVWPDSSFNWINSIASDYASGYYVLAPEGFDFDLLVSEDGRETWSVEEFPDRTGSDAADRFDLAVVDGKRIRLIAHDRGYAWVDLDDGRGWLDVSYGPGSSNDDRPYGISVWDETNMLIGTRASGIFYWEPVGETFAVEDGTGSFWNLQHMSEDIALAGDSGGRFVRLSGLTGGANPTQTDLTANFGAGMDATADTYAISPKRAEDGVAVVLGYNISGTAEYEMWWTDDDGATFTRIATPPDPIRPDGFSYPWEDSSYGWFRLSLNPITNRFVVLDEFEGFIYEEVAGSGATQWQQVRSVGAGDFNVWLDMDQDVVVGQVWDSVENFNGSPGVLEDYYILSYQNTSELLVKDVRFQVKDVGGGAVDLTPVLDELTLMKGSTFDTNTDSLEAVRDELTAMEGATFDTNTDSLEAIRDNQAVADLTPVLNELSDIKGATFDTGTDSLEAIRNAVDAQASDLSEILSKVTRTLGLSQENYRITGQVYNGNGQLTSATLAIYPTAADVTAQTNAIETYTLAATYDGSGLLVDYSVERVGV